MRPTDDKGGFKYYISTFRGWVVSYQLALEENRRAQHYSSDILKVQIESVRRVMSLLPVKMKKTNNEDVTTSCNKVVINNTGSAHYYVPNNK